MACIPTGQPTTDVGDGWLRLGFHRRESCNRLGEEAMELLALAVLVCASLLAVFALAAIGVTVVVRKWLGLP